MDQFWQAKAIIEDRSLSLGDCVAALQRLGLREIDAIYYAVLLSRDELLACYPATLPCVSMDWDSIFRCVMVPEEWFVDVLEGRRYMTLTPHYFIDRDNHLVMLTELRASKWGRAMAVELRKRYAEQFGRARNERRRAYGVYRAALQAAALMYDVTRVKALAAESLWERWKASGGPYKNWLRALLVPGSDPKLAERVYVAMFGNIPQPLEWNLALQDIGLGVNRDEDDPGTASVVSRAEHLVTMKSVGELIDHSATSWPGTSIGTWYVWKWWISAAVTKSSISAVKRDEILAYCDAELGVDVCVARFLALVIGYCDGYLQLRVSSGWPRFVAGRRAAHRFFAIVAGLPLELQEHIVGLRWRRVESHRGCDNGRWG